jgi:DNA polymerase III sliding clamp (beta) subunit (PCNA family)
MKLVESSELEFTASGKDMAAALAKILAVTTYVKSDDSKFIIAATKDGLYLIGASTDALACVKMGGEVKKPGTIRIEYETVTGLLKTRTEMIFKATKGQLAFKEKKSNFQAQINVREFDADDIELVSRQLNDPTSVPMKKGVVEKMRKAIKKVALLDVYAGTDLSVAVQFTEKTMMVFCYDQYHIALFKVKLKGMMPLRMALPVKAFNVIDKFMETDEVNFSTSGGRLRAFSNEFIVSIPEVQHDDGWWKGAKLYVDHVDEMKHRASLTFDVNATKTITNMGALTDKDTRMAIQMSKNEVTLAVNGKGGRVSDKFKAKTEGKDIDMRVDPRIFMDLFKKLEVENVLMNVYKATGATSAYVLKSEVNDGNLTLVGTYDEAK